MKIITSVILLALGMATFGAAQANAATVQITIKNTAEQDGIWIMRPWIGLHDGNFPTYMVGQPAASGIQHIAEDGVSGDTTNPTLLSGPPNVCAGDPTVYNTANPCQYDIFAAYSGGSQQVTIGGPTAPGGTLVATLTVDPLNLKSQYLSFIVMLVPSNDAFFGTDSAHPIRIYDSNGLFNGGLGPIRFKVSNATLFDAGTEVNTESSTDTAFFGQTVPGTGTHPDVIPVIHRHPGFGPLVLHGFNIYPGSQLNHFDRANTGSNVAEVTITELP
ncbi:MAG: spondin domain-containing protein [Chthoniobacterales bacterium]|nr:spondin domain-containing protein [Chthoniobacterales bacterium]